MSFLHKLNSKNFHRAFNFPVWYPLYRLPNAKNSDISFQHSNNAHVFNTDPEAFPSDGKIEKIQDVPVIVESLLKADFPDSEPINRNAPTQNVSPIVDPFSLTIYQSNAVLLIDTPPLHADPAFKSSLIKLGTNIIRAVEGKPGTVNVSSFIWPLSDHPNAPRTQYELDLVIQEMLTEKIANSTYAVVILSGECSIKYFSDDLEGRTIKYINSESPLSELLYSGELKQQFWHKVRGAICQ